MDRLMLIVRMADAVVAIPADRVESVVEIEAMTPVPHAPPHVAGLAALRSRVVTIVDPRAVLDVGGGLPALPFATVIVPVEGHPYGIVVDEVLDVVEQSGAPSPAQGRSAAGWDRVVQALVVVGDRQYPMVDPGALIAGRDVAGTAVAGADSR